MYEKPGLRASLFARAVVCSLLALICGAVGAFAARPYVPAEKVEALSAGTAHSIKGVGVCVDYDTGNGVFNSFYLTADLVDILTGKASTPGLKFTYHYNMVLKEMCEGKYIIYAGPGVTSGYVRNTDDHSGFMGGVSLDAGVRTRCLKNIYLSLEYQADASLIFKNKYNPYMRLYRAGFLYAWAPYLRIQYNF